MVEEMKVAADDRLVEEYTQQGYLIVRSLFTPDEVAEIREVFQAQADGGPVEGLQHTAAYTDPNDPLARYPRMMHPHRHPELSIGPLAMKVMLDARFKAILGSLFGEEPIAAQSMFYFKPPGSRGQALHQDNFYLRVSPGSCMAAWIAVDDADRENGGMVVVPGSHKMEVVCPDKADPALFFTTEHIPVPEGMEEQPVDMKAGDVLFFNGSLIHGSYPNTSADRFRRSLICHYIPISSLEVSAGYRPLLNFDGQEVSHVDDATGGGPCGGEWTPVEPH